MTPYTDLLVAGAFPGRIDPWAEIGRYFMQIHAGIIGALLAQMQPALLAMGYAAARETSLQVLNRREPDVQVRSRDSARSAPRRPFVSYVEAAQALEVEYGIALAEPQLDRITVRQRDETGGRLVTVLEVISPTNKRADDEIAAYRHQRAALLAVGVNVVEIDPTRSVKRMIAHAAAHEAPYHIAVHLPGEWARLLPVLFEQPLPRFALPLLDEALPLDPAAAYTDAYRTSAAAAQLLDAGDYTPDRLPFPTALTEAQRAAALASLDAWRAALARAER